MKVSRSRQAFSMAAPVLDPHHAARRTFIKQKHQLFSRHVGVYFHKSQLPFDTRTFAGGNAPLLKKQM